MVPVGTRFRNHKLVALKPVIRLSDVQSFNLNTLKYPTFFKGLYKEVILGTLNKVGYLGSTNTLKQQTDPCRDQARGHVTQRPGRLEEGVGLGSNAPIHGLTGYLKL